MSLRFKMHQPSPYCKANTYHIPQVCKGNSLSFLSPCSLPKRMWHLVAWVCRRSLSLPGGPCSLDGVACGRAVVPLAFLLFPLGAGIPTSSDFNGWISLQPKHLNIFSSSPHLLCGILSCDNSFCLFHIRTHVSAASDAQESPVPAHISWP